MTPPAPSRGWPPTRPPGGGGAAGGAGGAANAMRELVIDGTRITDDGDCYVIAEIGHNHQGSVEKARELSSSRQSAA